MATYGTCQRCQTIQRVEVERDELGGYSVMKTHRCEAPGCTVELCPSCPRFECDGCRKICCPDHRNRIGSEEFCPACYAEILDEAMEECRCVCVGDLADASDCRAHGGVA